MADYESYVAESLKLAFPLDIPMGRRVVLSLTGYFDESGTHADSKAVCVAGYLSTPEQWQQFEIEWKAVLARYHLEMFRMADYANHAQAFSNWAEEDRRACFASLVDVINRNTLAGVGIGVPIAPYKAAFQGGLDRFMGGPYGLSATAVMMDVAEVLRGLTIDEAWVAYVFESGAKGKGNVLNMFTANKRNPETKNLFRLLSIRFENKRQFVPLQAADVLAYELGRQLPKQIGEDGRPPRRFHLDPLRDGQPSRWFYLDEQEIRKWANIVTLAQREQRSERQPRNRPS